MILPAAELLEYYRGPASDTYFRRAHDTLRGEGLDPVVTVDYFGDRAGVLCGLNQVLEILRGALGEGGEAWALAEGDAIEAKELVLRVRARYSRFGLYETAILGILASCTGWATRAAEVAAAAAGTRVISFGARHVHPLVGPVMEYAAVVGGCNGCSTPLGAQLAGLEGPSGTMPHAMILIFGDTLAAAQAFDRHMGPDVLRIVLVDTFKDEAEESLRVAAAMQETRPGSGAGSRSSWLRRCGPGSISPATPTWASS